MTRLSKMAGRQCMLLLVISSAFASDVPVLMWSPERPLSDLPQVPAFDKISQDAFHSSYLDHLLGKESNVIVAFLQDKLNINDISKYADVYSSDSDGGAFKHVKGLLDEHFSLELPRVLGSHLALDSLRDGFPGDVHHVTSVSDLSGLNLGGEGNHLVIVQLLPVAGAENPEAAFASNDATIGEVSKELQKRKVRYTAFYTAETSEERQKREAHQTRQLMVAPQDATSDGVFFNVTYGNSTVYAYLTYITVCVVPKFDSDSMPTYCPFNVSLSATDLKNADMTAQMGGNKTLSVQLKMDNIKTNFSSDTYSLVFKMPFQHRYDRWEILEAQLSVKNSSVGDMVKEAEMVTRGYDPVVSLLYSFHCSSMEWYPKNTTLAALGYITLGGFQIQPFNVQGDVFLLSQDCVGWFSIAIWMSLVPVALHILILLFGMYMIMSLSTNDRFDDPKGKPLIINAGE